MDFRPSATPQQLPRDQLAICLKGFIKQLSDEAEGSLNEVKEILRDRGYTEREITDLFKAAEDAGIEISKYLK